MSKENSPISINLPLQNLDKPIVSAVTPAATELGDTLGALIYLALGSIPFKAQKLKKQRELQLQLFEKELRDKINAKPENTLTEPKMQIVGQAIEASSFCLDEPVLREMFSNLITNAADTRFQSSVHPCFSSIIKQLSPLDAENLVLFKTDPTLPIVEYDYKLSGNHIQVLSRNVFLSNTAMQSEQEISMQAASLDSLSRHGLISIDYDRRIAHDPEYAPFYKISLYQKYEQNLPQIPSNCDRAQLAEGTPLELIIQKGYATLTPLGISFMAVCFNY